MLWLAWLLSWTVRLPWNVRPAPTLVATSLKAGKKLRKIKSTYQKSMTISFRTVRTLFRWLYSYFLAVDANFRLKLKSRGITDPGVGSGWSYFVENQKYIEHVSQETSEEEVNPFVRPLINFAHFFSGCWLWFRFPCRQPGERQVLEGLRLVWCCRLRVCTAFSRSKEWGW